MKDVEVTQIARALGDPNRLAIYTHIAQHDELFCGEMHAKHAISAATLSHHLKVLADLGLITSRKAGLNVYYRTVPEKFQAYLKYLEGINPKAKVETRECSTSVSYGSKTVAPVVRRGVGKATFPASLDCLRPLGYFVSFGSASGPIALFDIMLEATH